MWNVDNLHVAKEILYPSTEAPGKGGFSFDLCPRNALLEEHGARMPQSRKTGTTIVGLVFQDGVVLGADTRATAVQIVCDKNCEKIHDLEPNISCCSAGTSADTENLTVSEILSSDDDDDDDDDDCEYFLDSFMRIWILMHTLSMLKTLLLFCFIIRLKAWDGKYHHDLCMFRYHGEVSAALVLGGVDLTGPHLHAHHTACLFHTHVYPHGSVDTLPFVTMGSGSVAAMAMFESRFKEGMTKDEATNLVCAAINTGIFNDLGSGSNVDLCIMTKGGKEYLRNYQHPNPHSYTCLKGYNFPRGDTAILSSRTRILRDQVQVVEGDTMEEG
ncbi:unnamed protein product [Sphagnum jensenii]|uniref:proteasome endopeptidase complex n=1 Tax=Sphagnum jensenii TaxID=128206 RepID=A0ABP1BJT7_9BRYO